MLKESIKTGISFGLTSGIITTLGLIVGLHSGTHSRAVVIGGILTIAVADAFSDALGIHVAQESQYRHSTREIWEATLATLITKFGFALTFVVPFLVLAMAYAIVASIVWGLLLLIGFNYALARGQAASPWRIMLEHVVIALVVISIAHLVGDWIGATFTD